MGKPLAHAIAGELPASYLPLQIVEQDRSRIGNEVGVQHALLVPVLGRPRLAGQEVVVTLDIQIGELDIAVEDRVQAVERVDDAWGRGNSQEDRWLPRA